MPCGIYSITNTKNNKRYIGSAIDIDRRWGKHKKNLRHGAHENKHLQSAWAKDGEDAFEFSVIAQCDPCELIDLEQFYIDAYQASDKRHGYNIRQRAESNIGLSWGDETKSKMSAAMKVERNRPDVIKKTSEISIEVWSRPGQRERASKRIKAVWSRPGQREKMSIALRATKKDDGRQSERMRECQRERWKDDEYKARISASIKDALNRPDIKAKQVEAIRAVNATPEMRKKRSAAHSGEKSSSAKLNNVSVLDIRERINAGERPMDIMARYGIARTTFENIRARRTWKHI